MIEFWIMTLIAAIGWVFFVVAYYNWTKTLRDWKETLEVWDQGLLRMKKLILEEP